MPAAPDDPSIRLDPSGRVAVMGAGPAGLMAAEVATRAGARVAVFDHMASAGRKLLVAGRGGLNLTHTEPLDALLARYGDARPRLEPAIRAFGPDDLRAWCADVGQPTFVGSSGRVFPDALRATPLLRSWLRRLDQLGVELRTRHEWTGWDAAGAPTVRGPDSVTRTVDADATVLALGGASWPRTGSNAGWVAVVEQSGIRVAPLRPANVGFACAWSTTFRSSFAGTPLKNIAASVEGAVARGEALVTETGIEGGAVYELSRHLRDRIEADGTAIVELDLRPDLTRDEVRERWVRRRPKDSATNALRRTVGLPPVAIGLLREVTGNRLPTDADELAQLVKAVPLTLVGVRPIDRAISTAGGIAFDEVDDRLMLRRRPGTFVAGEMLDWEAPTGGYLLQATFSTAVLAGRSAARWRDQA